MALRTICSGKMGKEAVSYNLKLIKLKNVTDAAARSIRFDKGVLEMHCACALGSQGMFNDGEIRYVLLEKL